MCSQPEFLTKHLKVSARLMLLTFSLLITANPQTFGVRSVQENTARTIVSEDFVRNRPKGQPRRKMPRKAGKATSPWFSSAPGYRLASSSSGHESSREFGTKSKVGLTFWRMRLPKDSDARTLEPLTNESQWIAERVEADTVFQKGDYLRLSIESPWAGYLYVIDRDWFADGGVGETKLIFPIQGDDNRLIAGKLIDIPAQNQQPFRANPKANQTGEILTMIVTSSPLSLPISSDPLPISDAQLREWERMWGGLAERFELEGGAGQVRTTEEQLAGRKGRRQLTRDDPPPQTIYVLATKNRDAFLFNVKLSYAR